MENKTNIRKRAEEKLKGVPAAPSPLSVQETQQLIQELQVHQIEIEMQNEDLRASQSQLEESRSRYADLYDSAPIGYCSLDQNGLILEINLKGAEQLGIERTRLIGKPLLIYIAEEDRFRFRALLGEAIKNQLKQTCELKINRKGENPFDFLVEWTLVQETDDGPVLRMALIDITERKRSEKEREELLAREQRARREAQEANRLKDEFLAMVSHELRTPLNAIAGWTYLLEMEELDPQTRTSALKAIARNTKAQELLINDLLDFSRIVGGKLSLQTRPVDLIPIIESAIETLRQGAEVKGIELRVTLDASIGPVLADPDRLQQVVWNLLSNAIKFTPDEGCIEVFLERVDPYIQIRVKDTGIGIPSDFLPHIFDGFRQAEESNTRSHGGLGLGLAIVQHLIELHGGSVFAESGGQEAGATLTIRLPIRALRTKEEFREPVGVSAEETGSFGRLPAVHGLRLLLVDDEADARQLLTIMLEKYWINVTTAASVEEAMEIMKRKRPDALIGDLKMPGEDGYVLIDRVRGWEKEQGLKEIPAVALTAYATGDNRRRALLAGFQACLSKPVEPMKLVTIIAELIQQSKNAAS